MSVAEAKSWFETTQQSLITLKSAKTVNGKEVTLKPNWVHAFKSKNSKYEVVETELLSQGGFGFATKESFDVYNNAKRQEYLTSLSRLVVVKNKETKNRVSFIMTIVGDKNFLEKKKFKINDTYLKRDNELSGYVLYHNLNGDFVNGWNYKEGKIKGKISISDASLPALSLKNFLKDEAIIYEWFEVTVTSYFSSGGNIGTSSYSYVYAVAVGVISYGSNGDGGGSDEAGGYNPASLAPVPCYCTNTCPVCGGCRDNLKSANIGECMPCTCPSVPLPVVLDKLKTNPKAECIYQKLSNGSILQDFITRYFGPTEPNHSFLGELNLTWTLGSVMGGYGEIIPIGVQSNNQPYSVEIKLDEVQLNGVSNTRVALTMLHEALHARLIADFYDDVRSTDFTTLFAYYKGWGYNGGGLDINQETTMLNFYSDEMATALQTFDQAQGIDHPLSFYTDAVKYSLGYNIFNKVVYPQGEEAYNTLLESTKSCN